MFNNRVLFESQHYVVCILACGLTVQSKHPSKSTAHLNQGKGKILPIDHKQFAEWSVAWNDLMDPSEGNDLCRGFLA
jgi:hypothetical protein